MIKSLRVPERLFQLVMWIVSLVFAGFLIGLGGRIVADLPGVNQSISREQFVDSASLARIRLTRDSLAAVERERDAERDRAQLALTAASNAYRSARESFDNWVATRQATTDPAQDPEVLRRTRALDGLKATERNAQTVVEGLQTGLLLVQQALQAQSAAENVLLVGAETPYQRAVFRLELRVFLIRLALTLPLLLVAGWLVARQRKSDYWPLARGFVLFALFAFFVELVPYLPSYGGYVRYAVGIVASLVAGLYVIRTMRAYLARRQQAEAQSESERRHALKYEEALRRMGGNMCPGCERPISGGAASSSNFCVHCGMKLFDNCGSCSTRKNAFFQFCPACGVSVADAGSRPVVPAGSAV